MQIVDPSRKPYTFDEVLIVLVLYGIELQHSPSFRSLVKCNKEKRGIDLMVYDNSPGQNSETKYFEKEKFRITCINDPKNPGVSKAYNCGIALAKEKNKKWILFLDQDTTLDESLLDKFLEAINSHRDIQIFATTLFDSDHNLISPSRYFFKRGFARSTPPIGKCKLNKTRPINSSVLISTEIFEKVGWYNPKIRLDFSDHEFFDRVSKRTKYLQVVASKSFHSLSTSDETNIEKIKIRFGFFCEGAHVAAKNSPLSRFQYFVVCIFRALKLSIKFKTFFFIKTLFNEWTKRID